MRAPVDQSALNYHPTLSDPCDTAPRIPGPARTGAGRLHWPKHIPLEALVRCALAHMVPRASHDGRCACRTPIRSSAGAPRALSQFCALRASQLGLDVDWRAFKRQRCVAARRACSVFHCGLGTDECEAFEPRLVVALRACCCCAPSRADCRAVAGVPCGQRFLSRITAGVKSKKQEHTLIKTLMRRDTQAIVTVNAN